MPCHHPPSTFLSWETLIAEIDRGGNLFLWHLTPPSPTPIVWTALTFGGWGVLGVYNIVRAGLDKPAQLSAVADLCGQLAAAHSGSRLR